MTIADKSSLNFRANVHQGGFPALLSSLKQRAGVVKSTSLRVEEEIHKTLNRSNETVVDLSIAGSVCV